jgi:acid phosphatase/tartrate-resistant acid phosphatase type 5
VWSGGAHGDTRQLRSWAGILSRADFYLCGHDHDQQVIVRPGLVEVVMGSGGAGLRATSPTAGSQLTRREFGFGYLALHGDTAEVVVVSIDGSVVARFPFTHAAIEAGAAPPRQ